MNKYIGRNDLCPCGSGKKYKKCCMRKEDNPEFSDPAKFRQIYKDLRKKSKIKECIYPDHTNCSERIVGAHSIQNNKILAKIADNGKVYMPLPKPDLEPNIQTTYGRKEASVFTGFCGFHDKTVFQPIEDRDFENTTEQVFLHVYRAFALEYQRKQEAVKLQQLFFFNKPSIAKQPGFLIKGKTGFIMAVNDYMEEKKIFDNALLTGDYDILTSFVWIFDGYSNFAATGGEAPSLDFEDNVIQDLRNPDIPARHIYISVFPEKDITVAIIAWLKQYDSVFSSIKNTLEKLDENQKKNYVNNTLPIVTENIAIKPSSWDATTEQAKTEFSILFTGFADLLENTEGIKYDRFHQPSFDFFSL